MMVDHIKTMVETQVVSVVKEEEKIENSVVSRFFCVPKPDGRIRPIINLRTINTYVRKQHFKMEGIKSLRDLIQANDFLIKIDLEDAFYHMMIHPSMRRFFRFQWKDQVYQFNVLPFGYRDAPRLFTMMLRVVLKEIRKQGVRLIAYMDDLLIMAESVEEACRARDIVLATLKKYGLTISLKKSVLTPSQIMDYLGLVVNTVNMTFSIPKEKVTRLHKKVKQMLTLASKSRRVNLTELQSLLGTLQSVADCVLPTRLHLNSLIEMLREEEEGLAHLTPQAVEDLNWWLEFVPNWNGKPIHPTPPTWCFDTDASADKWGAVWFSPTGRLDCNGAFVSVMSSNTRELTAIFNGVQSLVNVAGWQDCAVRVRTDNLTALSYVNRMGGKDAALSRLAEKLHHFCLSRRIILTAEYIPGKENVTADYLSRLESDWSEGKLHPHLFRLADERWGPHTLDGCAGEENTQCKLHISYRANPTCLYTDILSRPLPSDQNIWLNPPFPLIPRLLAKIRREKATVTMLLPVWPNRPWWAVPWKMLCDWPLDWKTFRVIHGGH